MNRKILMLDTLDDLTSGDLSRFQWYLKMPVLDGFSPIPRGHLENLKKSHDIVDALVQRYTLDGAIKVTVEILKRMNQNDLSQKLVRNAGMGRSTPSLPSQAAVVHLDMGRPTASLPSQTAVVHLRDQTRARDAETSHVFPDVWDVMPANTPCQSFTIQPLSPEYNDVLSLFRQTCNGDVLKIERIQNPSLWKSVLIKKNDMEARNGHQNNERKLFHGTCHTIIQHINEYGFNRSYAGRNAAYYGNGTYFAVNANYCAMDTYSRPDSQGQKCVYLCRVLVGDYTQGKPGLLVPPSKSSTMTQRYDSVTDNPDAPSMFVTFHDSQAYPEYLITFKML